MWCDKAEGAHLLALSSDVGSATMRREQLYCSSGTASRVFSCRQKIRDHHPAAPRLCGNQAFGQLRQHTDSTRPRRRRTRRGLQTLTQFS